MNPSASDDRMRGPVIERVRRQHLLQEYTKGEAEALPPLQRTALMSALRKKPRDNSEKLCRRRLYNCERHGYCMMEKWIDRREEARDRWQSGRVERWKT